MRKIRLVVCLICGVGAQAVHAQSVLGIYEGDTTQEVKKLFKTEKYVRHYRVEMTSAGSARITLSDEDISATLNVAGKLENPTKFVGITTVESGPPEWIRDRDRIHDKIEIVFSGPSTASITQTYLESGSVRTGILKKIASLPQQATGVSTKRLAQSGGAAPVSQQQNVDGSSNVSLMGSGAKPTFTGLVPWDKAAIEKAMRAGMPSGADCQRADQLSSVCVFNGPGGTQLRYQYLTQLSGKIVINIHLGPWNNREEYDRLQPYALSFMANVSGFDVASIQKCYADADAGVRQGLINPNRQMSGQTRILQCLVSDGGMGRFLGLEGQVSAADRF